MKFLLRSKLVLIGLLTGLGCAWGVVNVAWLYRSDGFTPGQIVFNVVTGIGLLALAIILTLQARKNPNTLGFSDEYSEARKRYASQIGVLVGLVLFVCSIFAKNLLPEAFETLTASFANQRDAFSSGHLIGGVTFYVGIMVGWAVAYIKYR